MPPGAPKKTQLDSEVVLRVTEVWQGGARVAVSLGLIYL